MTSDTSHRRQRFSALLDLILIISVLLIFKSILLQVDSIWTFAGPISLTAALAVATWRLWRRRESWASLGLRRPDSITGTLRWTLVALVVTVGVGILADSLATSFIGAPGDVTQAIDSQYQSRFDSVPGNLNEYLFWLVVAWVIGGFVEEMLFRAALFSRFEQFLHGVPFATIIAIIFQAILFGHQHLYYQGLSGWIATGAIGVASGLLYLACNRNLWPLILSHGLSNTIGLTLLYLGLMS